MNDTMMQKELNKSEQLFQLLYDSIRRGDIPNGARLATEVELAEKHNCSRITVRSSLRQLEELKLIRRVRGNGTYVSSDGVRFSNRRSIAIVGQEMHPDYNEIDPYFSHLMMGLFQGGNTFDFSANFIIMRRGDRDFLDSFERQGINLSDYDGLIFAKQLTVEEIAALEGGRRRFVALQAPAGDSQISYVTIDNFNGVYTATRHLLERGRRDIVFLHVSVCEKINRDKVEGFQKALEEFGLTSPAEQRHYEIKPCDENDTATLIARLLAEGQKFDALLVHGDWATIGVVRVLRKAQLRIPEDVALVMYDDYSMVQRFLGLSITAVRQPFQRQVQCALELLFRQFQQPQQEKTIQLLQPMLMVRETT